MVRFAAMLTEGYGPRKRLRQCNDVCHRWVTLADPALVLLQCLPQNCTWFYYQFSSNPLGNRMILFWFLGQNRLILKVLWKDAVGNSQPHTPQGQRRGERSHVLSALTPYSFISSIALNWKYVPGLLSVDVAPWGRDFSCSPLWLQLLEQAWNMIHSQ